MRVLIAPDKFKGSLTAHAAAEAIARGWGTGWPECSMVQAPIADGGEGFASALCGALGGEWIELSARDPLGRPVAARYAWVASESLAVIEMSEASGLWRLAGHELAPLAVNTYGTGELMRDAIARGAARIVVGLGGSATTDAGAGMAAALGYQFSDASGAPLDPLPRHLGSVAKISRPAALRLPDIIAACDVQNPLLGERGTARIFSPQKGADPATVEQLENTLAHFSRVVTRDLGHDFRETAGAGAAGGIGYGLLSFCGASIRSGFDLVSELLDLPGKIAEADLVITAEGGLDGQTLEGKGPAGVAALAHTAGKLVLAFGGRIEEPEKLDLIFDAVCPIVDRPMELACAIAHGAELLETAAFRAARMARLGSAWKSGTSHLHTGLTRT